MSAKNTLSYARADLREDLSEILYRDLTTDRVTTFQKFRLGIWVSPIRTNSQCVKANR